MSGDDAATASVWGQMRTSASNTIGLVHLTELLRVAPGDASFTDYVELMVTENVLGRETSAGRARTLRQLREVFSLDDRYLPFRALRDLWNEDKSGQPLMAGLLAFTRDELLRDSYEAVREHRPGESVTARELAKAVALAHPVGISTGTLSKVGRNTGSSWQQIGHLSGKTGKIRARVSARPATVAYALFLGYLSGLRGSLLMETPWTSLLDTTTGHLRQLAMDASRLGYLEFKTAGAVDELGFSHLLRGIG